jgi:hypothetical protein
MLRTTSKLFPVDEFDGKWLRGRAPQDEPLVGSADIQSLADDRRWRACVREFIPDT